MRVRKRPIAMNSCCVGMGNAVVLQLAARAGPTGWISGDKAKAAAPRAFQAKTVAPSRWGGGDGSSWKNSVEIDF